MGLEGRRLSRRQCRVRILSHGEPTCRSQLSMLGIKKSHGQNICRRGRGLCLTRKEDRLKMTEHHVKTPLTERR